MTTHKALYVPADDSKPVEVFDHRDGDMGAISDRVGTTETGMSTVSRNVTAAYDDIGLYRQPQNVNNRAMQIWAAEAGRSARDFIQPLVGDYVFLGSDEYGEYADLPEHLTNG